LQLQPEEQAALLTAFSNPEKTQANGVRLAREKYFALRADARSVYGKKGVSRLHAICSSNRVSSNVNDRPMDAY
jgi:hypothetical protein